MDTTNQNDQDVKLLEAMVNAFVLLSAERQHECLSMLTILRKVAYPQTYAPGTYWTTQPMTVGGSVPLTPYQFLTTSGDTLGGLSGIGSHSNVSMAHPLATGLYDS